MLYSNINPEQRAEILNLVPDAFDDPDEYWRIVPETAPGLFYSISSKRDIVIRHTYVDNLGRVWKPKSMKMILDCCTYAVSINRSRKGLSTYVEHVRYDAFPELNEVKTLDDDERDAIDVPYEGIEWFGRHKTTVHIIPVSDSDMKQVREFYPEDLPRELWAYVPETNRKYVISTQCRGVILKRYCATGTILKAQKWQLTSRGYNGAYYECCLTVGDHQLNSVSHPQVIRSFIPKPSDNYYEVNHIDGDKHNNVLDNLEWVTRQENSDHYNKSPEMLTKRQEGYRKISEWGKKHQKEIQNKPGVNEKRSATLKKGMTEEKRRRMAVASHNAWTEDRKKQQAELSRKKWNSYSEEEKHQRSLALSAAGVRGRKQKRLFNIGKEGSNSENKENS